MKEVKILIEDDNGIELISAKVAVHPATNPAALMRFGSSFRQLVETIHLPPFRMFVDEVEVK